MPIDLRSAGLGAALLLVAGCGEARPEPGTPRGAGGWVTASEAEAGPKPTVGTTTPAVTPLPLEACGATEQGFEGWMVSYGKHAIAEHVSPRAVADALDGLAYDPEVAGLDRGQQGFKVPFEEFARAHVTRARLARAKVLLENDAAWLGEIEKRFGVPREILVAIWGLETDFGDNTGNRSCLRALATLAYDCRRPELFRGELLAALRIVDKGDISPDRMLGAWAGEIGQTQFLPTSYERYAIDFDGDGHKDLVGSSQDALASTANYLKEHGYTAGQPFKEGSPNFSAIATWNASTNYVKSVVLFASKISSRR